MLISTGWRGGGGGGLHRYSFEIRVDSGGRGYAKLCYNEVAKNRNGIDQNVDEHQKKMFQEENFIDLCPVKSLELYLSKRNPSCSVFSQQCNPRRGESGRWYDNMPVGRSTLGKMMSKISAEAQYSERYTDPCLQATAVTALSYAGIAPKDVCSVAGHHSEASLKHYCQEPTDEQKADMSKKQHSYRKKASI